MVEKVTDKRMNITHKGLTYLPWSGHLWCRIIPTENSLGTPSLQQKRCSRPCAHPPAAAALLPAPAALGIRSVHLSVRGRVTFPAGRRRPWLGALCSCCRQRTGAEAALTHSCCLAARTMQGCALLSPGSIFLLEMFAGSASVGFSNRISLCSFLHCC